MPKITAEDFVRTWQTSNSAKEVAEKLDIPLSYAYSKAQVLREKGVPLKSFEKPKLDYTSLIELAEKLA